MSVFAWLIQGPIPVLEPLISISYCISSTENIIWYLLGNCLWLSTSLKLKWFCCRSLVHRLEKVDPSRMKNDEKLAFWINIHNALVMHVMNGFHCKILKKKKNWYWKFKVTFSSFCVSRKDTHLFFFMLLLQAYLAYGIPQNSLKRGSLLVKVSLVTFLLEETLLSGWLKELH